MLFALLKWKHKRSAPLNSEKRFEYLEILNVNLKNEAFPVDIHP